MATLAETERNDRDERTIAKLRKKESTQVAAIVTATKALAALLDEFTNTERSINGVRAGAGAGGVIRPDLHRIVVTQLTSWERRQPELLGLAPLPTRGEQRLIDAKTQLASAERNKAKFEHYVQDASRPLPNQKRRRDDFKRSVKHNKAVVAWAEKHQKERRPSEPRPAYESDPNTLVTMAAPDTQQGQTV